jgi:hypothetical protein
MTWPKSNRKQDGEKAIEAYEEEVNWELKELRVRRFVICNSGHVL